MAIAKKEKHQEGAPAWLVTYGDMVTLMLTFFVMLLAMSEVKKEDHFLEFMQAIREAFGYQGGMRQTQYEEVLSPKNINFTEMLVIPIEPHDFSRSRQRGLQGRDKTVRSRQPDDVYVVGGGIQFASLSAELEPTEAASLEQFAEQLRGHNTMVRITGHCSRRPVDGTPFRDHMDLAYQRARAVREQLVTLGIDAGRLVIEVAGTNEPEASQAYTEEIRRRNDLVEILQVNRRVDEFTP
ncbi:MAG: flagellar motor protein MotB [Phycisphaerae bacterium]|jgi:chemotaxis protein MotB